VKRHVRQVLLEDIHGNVVRKPRKDYTDLAMGALGAGMLGYQYSREIGVSAKNLKNKMSQTNYKVHNVKHNFQPRGTFAEGAMKTARAAAPAARIL
jgi:hypothetical protein